MKPKLLITGYKRHGKDTVAEILRDNWGYTFQDSSRAALGLFLFDILAVRHGYTNKEQAYQDRVNHRKEWFDEICKYNTPDPTRLAREIMKSSDIYVGMRSKRELEACMEGGVFDHAIWVDASERLPPEDADSCNVAMCQADIVLHNHEGLDELTLNVGVLAAQLQPWRLF